jgi:ribokinase
MIVVFGSINLDLIFPLPRIPAPGETVLAPELAIAPGGKGANQACAAARDGARVVMAGAVGGDALATDALRLLRAAGADLSRVRTVEAVTGTAAIFVAPDGQNAIGVGSSANLHARAAQVEDALLGPHTTLLLQMEVPVVENVALIRRARRRGARILLNLAPAADLPRDALTALDVLVANETEAAFLAGRLGGAADAAALSRALGIDVVRTLGGAGSEYSGRDGMLRLPAHPVSVVDTTAAGDCFCGVLAAALDRGLPMSAALRRATVAAALACARRGTQNSLPLASETDAEISRTA